MTGTTTTTVIAASRSVYDEEHPVTKTTVSALDDEVDEAIQEELVEDLDVRGHPAHDHARPSRE